MDTFTIEMATGTDRDPALPVLAGVLGVHPWAVALVTLGWPADCILHHTPNSAGPALLPAWYVGARASERKFTQRAAANLVAALRTPGPQSLASTHPAHPLLAALTGLGNLAALRQWMRRGGPLPHVCAQGPFLRLAEELPAGTLPVPWRQGHEPVRATISVPLAAALITAGFLPFPTPLRDPDGRPSIGFLDDPLCPGLLDTCLSAGVAAVEAAREGKNFAPLLAGVLGTAAPGEHPFQNALAACLNLPVMLLHQTERSRNPVRVLQNPRVDQKRALVTQSLLDGGDRRSEKVKSFLRTHLSATS